MITSFNNGPFTFKRRAATTYTNGKAVLGAESDVVLDGSLQPMNSRDVLLLPEGQRTRENLKLYTDTQLFPAEKETGRPADRLTIGSSVYEVTGIEMWTLTDIPHYKAILTKAN